MVATNCHKKILCFTLESKLSMNEVMYCIEVIKSARELQDEKVVKELLLKHIDGYTSDVV